MAGKIGKLSTFLRYDELPEGFTDEHRYRFWSYVLHADGCWLWSASVKNRNYGQFVVRDGPNHYNFSSHRLAWLLTYGPIPNNLWVLHKCDNPLCVKPTHLFLGTHLDNMADMSTKQRTFKQAWKHIRRVKMSPEKAEEVRQLSSQGCTLKMLAERYGVGTFCIQRILQNKRWSKEVHSA